MSTQHTCPWCGSAFTPARPGTVFCSDKCRTYHGRKRTSLAAEGRAVAGAVPDPDSGPALPSVLTKVEMLLLPIAETDWRKATALHMAHRIDRSLGDTPAGLTKLHTALQQLLVDLVGPRALQHQGEAGSTPPDGAQAAKPEEELDILDQMENGKGPGTVTKMSRRRPASA